MLIRFFKVVASCAAVMIIMSSCSSVRVSDKYNGQQISPESVTPIAHINAQCFGLYFFDSVPIIVGSTSWPGMFMLFCDNVNSEDVTAMLMEKADNLRATRVLDVASHCRVEPNHLLFYLITVRSITVSGNAVK